MKCLIFSGGAEKGIAYIGILKFLEEHKLLDKIESIYGTSIGAVIGTLISIGYTYRELEYLIKKSNVKELILPDEFNIDNLINLFGFHEPQKLHRLIRLLIDKKTNVQNITFKQHFEKYKIKIVITSSCLSEYKCYYFSYENVPDLPIIDAITMSICIPILFQPIKYDNKLFVDGALYDNYPIFEATQKYKKEDILGFFLLNNHSCKKEIDNIQDYLIVLLKSIDVKFVYLPINLYNDITISLKLNHIIDTKDTLKLIEIGYDCFKEYYHNNIQRFHKTLYINMNSINNKDIVIKYNDDT